MEAYRSGHNGPDSKSGSPHGLVGSNPTASAIYSKHFRCHAEKPHGIGVFRGFGEEKIQIKTIDAKGGKRRTGGFKPLVYP